MDTVMVVVVEVRACKREKRVQVKKQKRDFRPASLSMPPCTSV